MKVCEVGTKIKIPNQPEWLPLTQTKNVWTLALNPTVKLTSYSIHPRLAQPLESEKLSRLGEGRWPLQENNLPVAAIQNNVVSEWKRAKFANLSISPLSNSKRSRWGHAPSSLRNGEKPFPHPCNALSRGLRFWVLAHALKRALAWAQPITNGTRARMSACVGTEKHRSKFYDLPVSCT